MMMSLTQNVASHALICNQRLSYYCVNLILFFSTLPFVAPIPVGSDVQYTVFLLSIALFFLGLYSGVARFNRLDVFFLLVALVSFVYIDPWSDYEYQFRKRVGLLFAFLLYYVVTKHAYLLNSKYFLAGVVVNILAVLVHWLAPNFFSQVGELFVRKIKVNPSLSARGVSGFAPEPGFTAGVAVYFICLAMVFYYQGKLHLRQYQWVVVASLFIVILSSSGTGVMLLAILSVLSFLFLRIKLWIRIAVIVSVLIAISYLMTMEVLGRGGYILKHLLLEPELIFIFDASVARRIVGFVTGILALMDDPLGHGVGTFYAEGFRIVSNSFLVDVYFEAQQYAGSIWSSFAQYALELGLLFVVLLTLLYFHTVQKRYIVVVRGLSFFYLVSSFSIIFPPLWILLALTDKSSLVLMKQV